MSKKIVYRPRISSKDIRKKIKFFYTEKFFNKWMSKYEYSFLTYQQKHYMMKKFWSEGSIAVSEVYGVEDLIMRGLIDMEGNEIIFTPWTFANRYNIYDFPTHVNLINTRGVKFITPRELEVDKEVVIIWAQKNHKSVFSSIEAKLNELVDIEMKKRVARKAQSQPWMFTFSPEDYAQAKILEDQLDNDEPYMFVPFQDVDKVKGIASGAPYVVDKFEQDRQKCEDDILTMLGVNNVGIGEKKEHLIVDEVNANNENVEQQSISFQSEIESGFERVYKCFGKKIDVIDMNEIINKEVEEEDKDNDTTDNSND